MPRRVSDMSVSCDMFNMCALMSAQRRTAHARKLTSQDALCACEISVPLGVDGVAQNFPEFSR
eukprot:2108466-Alexandrium_andersonii.AAC.1